MLPTAVPWDTAYNIYMSYSPQVLFAFGYVQGSFHQQFMDP